MAKYLNVFLMDLALAEIQTHATRMLCLNGQPANYAAAIAAPYYLGGVAVGPGDFVLVDDGLGGRKLTFTNAALEIQFANSGVAERIGFVNDTLGQERLYLVTDLLNPQNVLAGNAMRVNAFDLQITAP